MTKNEPQFQADKIVSGPKRTQNYEKVDQEYVPISLPYKKGDEDMEVEVEPMSKKSSIIKLMRTKSENRPSEKNELTQIQKLFLDSEGSQRETKQAEQQKPFLIQMPCTIPFDIPQDTESLLKIGKLRFHKSGKVVLRILNEKGQKLDLLVNQGISNSFYQELVSVSQTEDSKQTTLSFLSQLEDKLVVTPYLESLLGSE